MVSHQEVQLCHRSLRSRLCWERMCNSFALFDRQDLEAMRRQMAIWQDRSAGDSDKSEREGKLLQEQLDARGAELAALRGHTTEVEADRDRAVQVGGGCGGTPSQPVGARVAVRLEPKIELSCYENGRTAGF